MVNTSLSISTDFIVSGGTLAILEAIDTFAMPIVSANSSENCACT